MIGKRREGHIGEFGYGEFPTLTMLCYLDPLLIEHVLLIVLPLTK